MAKCGSCRQCCRTACKVLLVALLVPILQETLGSIYVIAEAWEDGIPFNQACKDMFYSYVSCGHPVFLLWSLLFMGSPRSVLVEATDDHATAICKTALMVKPTEVSIAEWKVLDTADPVSTRDRMVAFMEVCKEIYLEMESGSAQRRILDEFQPPLGKVAELPNITAPFYHGPMSWESAEAQRAERQRVADSRPSLSHRWKPIEDLEPAHLRARLANSSVRPVQEQVIAASEVPEAIRQGQVAVFDATQLLPRELFNLSMAEIARMHGDLGKDIPIYRQLGPQMPFSKISLSELGHRFEVLQRAGKLYHNMAPIPRPGQSEPPPPKAGWLRTFRDVAAKLGPQTWVAGPEAALHFVRRTLTQPTVNIRRLPKLPPVSLEETLGRPPWLERVWSMLWCGAVGSWWHNDEMDNLLIATNKAVTVAVFLNQNDTDVLSGMRGPVHRFAEAFDLAGFDPDGVDPSWLQENRWLEKFPYIRVQLEPGMGVTVPSRTYHTVVAEDADRLLLNAFLVPRYKAMEDAPAGHGSFFGAGRQPEPYMALMHLKTSTVIRLWDTQHLGGFFEMFKLETF